MIADEEMRDRLVEMLACSQCGEPLYERACGPTHAILKEEPWRHRMFVDWVTDHVESRRV